MKTKFRRITLPLSRLFGAMLLFHSSLVLAADDESFANYDSIVNELKSSVDEPPPNTSANDTSWEDVALHAGVAVTGSYVSITAPNGASGSGLLKGVEINFGVNLFSREARAEGSFSSFAPDDLASRLKADLKEFELRFVWMPHTPEGSLVRVGTGLAARYLDINASESGRWSTYQATTPAWLALLGVERKISPNLSFGPELSYRSAVITDTFDKSSWDASFRLNATF